MDDETRASSAPPGPPAPPASPGPTATAAPPAVVSARRSGLDLVTIVGGTVGVQAMALVTGIITARLLGVEGRGEIALVVAVSALVSRVTIGGSVPVAVAQLLSRDRLVARTALRPLVGRWAALGVAACAVAGVYTAWVLRGSDAEIRVGLAVGVAVLAAQQMVAHVLVGALQGELAPAARLVVGSMALQVPYLLMVVSAYVVGLDLDPVGVTAIQAVASVVGLAYCWRLLRAPDPGDPRVLDRAEVGRASRASYLASVGSIDSIGLDRNLIGPLLGTVALGLYTAAATVATAGALVGQAVAMLLLPRVSALQGHPDEERRLLRLWLPGAALVLLALVAGLQLVVDPLVRLAFGEAFAPAVETARWLLVADGLLGFRRVLNAVLQGRGHGGTASWVEAVLTVVLVVGVVAAALVGSLVLAGVTMGAVGALSVAALGLALRRHARLDARFAAGTPASPLA